jgi:hypothetical protein
MPRESFSRKRRRHKAVVVHTDNLSGIRLAHVERSGDISFIKK